jgi:hypothetical protein
MSDATCKTCPWCQELLASIDGLDGECHKNAPTVDGETAHNMRMPVGSALWPLVSMGRDWCGSHPDRQPRLECAATTLVGRETFPTESDMQRIFDMIEMAADRAARATP